MPRLGLGESFPQLYPHSEALTPLLLLSQLQSSGTPVLPLSHAHLPRVLGQVWVASPAFSSTPGRTACQVPWSHTCQNRILVSFKVFMVFFWAWDGKSDECG